jgi:hypothetical protein
MSNLTITINGTEYDLAGFAFDDERRRRPGAKRRKPRGRCAYVKILHQDAVRDFIGSGKTVAVSLDRGAFRIAFHGTIGDISGVVDEAGNVRVVILIAGLIERRSAIAVPPRKRAAPKSENDVFPSAIGGRFYGLE